MGNMSVSGRRMGFDLVVAPASFRGMAMRAVVLALVLAAGGDSFAASASGKAVGRANGNGNGPATSVGPVVPDLNGIGNPGHAGVLNPLVLPLPEIPAAGTTFVTPVV